MIFRQEWTNLAAAIRQAEDEIAGEALEVVVVLASNGTLRYRNVGDRDRVSAPRDVLADSIVVHNHPGGDSLSRTDVRLLLENKIAQMRVVTGDAVYVLDLPPDTEWEDVEDLVTLPIDQVREQHRDLVLAGQLTYEESERRRWHDIWTGVAEIRGWPYRRVPRMTS